MSGTEPFLSTEGDQVCDPGVRNLIQIEKGLEAQTDSLAGNVIFFKEFYSSISSIIIFQLNNVSLNLNLVPHPVVGILSNFVFSCSAFD